MANEGNFYNPDGRTILEVTKVVRSQSRDGWVYFSIHPKLKKRGRRSGKKGRARVWWFKDMCRRIK